MPLRLIDYEKPVPIEISGTKFIVRPLNQGSYLKIMNLMKNITTDDGINDYEEKTRPELVRLLMSHIADIDLFELEEESFEAILNHMCLADFMELVNKVVNISTPTETELKN